MRSKSLLSVLAAALPLLAACSGLGPTASPSYPYSFTLSTSLTNLTGAATIVDAQMSLDNQLVVDSCPPADQSPVFDADNNIIGYDCNAPAMAAVTLAGSGGIGPGGHQLVVLLSAITPSTTLNPYRVAAFSITVRQGSRVVKTVSLPAQTATLGPGANGGPRTIVYSFTI